MLECIKHDTVLVSETTCMYQLRYNLTLCYTDYYDTFCITSEMIHSDTGSDSILWQQEWLKAINTLA